MPLFHFKKRSCQNELRDAHERAGFQEHDATVLTEFVGQYLPEGSEETARHNESNRQQSGALFRQANDNSYTKQGLIFSRTVTSMIRAMPA